MIRTATPTGRIGSIDDIVNLALFILSEAGTNLNGAIVVSDGGLCLTGRFCPGLRAAGVTGAMTIEMYQIGRDHQLSRIETEDREVDLLLESQALVGHCQPSMNSVA